MKKSTAYKVALVLGIVFVITGTITALLVQGQVSAHADAGGLLNPKREPYTEQWSLALAENGLVEVRIPAVEVKVESYDGKEIIADFTGYTTPDNKGIHPRILADASGQKIKIKQNEEAASSTIFNIGPNFGSNGTIRGQMTIQLPRSLALDLDVGSFSGGVSVADHPFGDLVISTSSGNIAVKNVSAAKRMDLQTFSGSIEAFSAKAQEGVLETSSGKIMADTLTLNTLSTNQFSGKLSLKNCTVQEDVELETSSGNVTVEYLTAEKLRIQTFSGDHRLTDVTVAGSLHLESSSGKMTCERVSAEQIEHQTFSGNMTDNDINTKKLKTDTSSGDLQATIRSHADLDCQSFSGKVGIKMPADYEFVLDVVTFSGSSDIGYPLKLNKKQTKEKSFSGVVGGGTYQVEIETSSGNVSLQPI